MNQQEQNKFVSDVLSSMDKPSVLREGMNAVFSTKVAPELAKAGLKLSEEDVQSLKDKFLDNGLKVMENSEEFVRNFSEKGLEGFKTYLRNMGELLVEGLRIMQEFSGTYGEEAAAIVACNTSAVGYEVALEFFKGNPRPYKEAIIASLRETNNAVFFQEGAEEEREAANEIVGVCIETAFSKL